MARISGFLVDFKPSFLVDMRKMLHGYLDRRQILQGALAVAASPAAVPLALAQGLTG